MCWFFATASHSLQVNHSGMQNNKIFLPTYRAYFWSAGHDRGAKRLLFGFGLQLATSRKITELFESQYRMYQGVLIHFDVIRVCVRLGSRGWKVTTAHTYLILCHVWSLRWPVSRTLFVICVVLTIKRFATVWLWPHKYMKFFYSKA